MRIAVVRGEGLATPEIAFLSAAVPKAVELIFLGEEAAEVGRLARAGAILTGARGKFLFARLNAYGERAVAGADAAWFVEPYLWMTQRGASFADRIGVPYVLTVWENLRNHPSVLLRPWRTRTQRVLNGARLIHCVSPAAADYVCEFGSYRDKIVIIPPGVDAQEFRMLPAPVEPPHRFLFIGRLVHEKGLVELIDAFEMVSNELPVELVIVGRGPLDTLVRQRADQLPGLTHFGYCERSELPAVLANAHTLVLPSKRRSVASLAIWEEQFGFVLAEAMMSGRSVIASNSGSIPQVVGGAGWIVDVQGLTEQLGVAMRSAASDFGEWDDRRRAGHARGSAQFDAGRNSDALLTAVQTALSG